jgi:hypothetical protein
MIEVWDNPDTDFRLKMREVWDNPENDFRLKMREVWDNPDNDFRLKMREVWDNPDNDFRLPLERYGEFGRDVTHKAFYNGYNVPTIFRNLKKVVLIVQ